MLTEYQSGGFSSLCSLGGLWWEAISPAQEYVSLFFVVKELFLWLAAALNHSGHNQPIVCESRVPEHSQG